MEAWQAVFRNLYTGFLLRDFAGKIVPGVFFLFSISAMFRSPRELIQALRKDLPLWMVILVAGFAWTITLGTQSLAEGLGIWKYFPNEPICATPQASRIGFLSNLLFGGDETSFNNCTAQVDRFQNGASEDQKQQYERFVVIKEACGNLFVSILLSTPAWLCVIFLSKEHNHGKPNVWRRLKMRVQPTMPSAIGVCYCLLILLGLHRMHAQHVQRQFNYTTIVIEHRTNESKTMIPNKPAQ